MSTDPFSDVLRLTDARSIVSGGFAAGGAWALHFPPPGKIKLFAVAKGACWLRLDGQTKARQLEHGDVFLVTGHQGFLLASSLTATPREARRVFRAEKTFVRLGDGSDCLLIGGHISLDPSSGGLLKDVLPPLILVRASSPQASAVRWILEQLREESGAHLPGASIVSAQLAQVMFVQVLRAHMTSAVSLRAGWLRANNDPQIAPALQLMHGEPGRDWTVAELAKAVAMSRTTFAARFKSAAAVPPLTYLTEWRMQLAQRVLRDADTSVSELGQSLGYSSESAFSNAFKRVVGSSPRNYRRAAKRLPSSSAEDTVNLELRAK